VKAVSLLRIGRLRGRSWVSCDVTHDPPRRSSTPHHSGYKRFDSLRQLRWCAWLHRSSRSGGIGLWRRRYRGQCWRRSDSAMGQCFRIEQFPGSRCWLRGSDLRRRRSKGWGDGNCGHLRCGCQLRWVRGRPDQCVGRVASGNRVGMRHHVRTGYFTRASTNACGGYRDGCSLVLLLMNDQDSQDADESCGASCSTYQKPVGLYPERIHRSPGLTSVEN